MPRLATRRPGEPLKIKGRPLPYSFWPMKRTTRRYGLQSHLFTPNPWAVIAASVRKNAGAPNRSAAAAFLGQAEEYYRAATTSGLPAAKPVLLYYCFLNLVKTYIATYCPTADLSRPKHGLSESLDPGRRELVDAYLTAYATGREANLFDMFLNLLTGRGLPVRTFRFEIPALLPQIVTGHRLWCQASNTRERFVAIEDIEFVLDATARQVWLRFFIAKGDLSRLALGHQRLLAEADLDNIWHEVNSSHPDTLCFEHRTPTTFGHLPSDVVADLASDFHRRLWATVLSLPPYRKYYLYAAPPMEADQVLPQLTSIYAIMFYLGSITRYRPQDFKKILDGDYGSQIYTILSEQPTQFIYLMTSEFAKQEVTKAAIV